MRICATAQVRTVCGESHCSQTHADTRTDMSPEALSQAAATDPSWTYAGLTAWHTLELMTGLTPGLTAWLTAGLTRGLTAWHMAGLTAELSVELTAGLNISYKLVKVGWICG